MNIDLASLPANVDQLQEIVRAMAAHMADDHRQIAEAKAEVAKLRQIIEKLQRFQFGRKSERLDDNQLALSFEDLEADIAKVEACVSRARSPVYQGHDLKRPQLSLRRAKGTCQNICYAR